MTNRLRTSRVPRSPGFTLMEVLAAITIFALGAVSIITMFPVAAKMQSETMGDIMSQMVMRNAEAYLKARPFNLKFLNKGSPIGSYADNFGNPVSYAFFTSTDPTTSTSVLRLPVRMIDPTDATKTDLGWLEPLAGINISAMSVGDNTGGIYTVRDRSYPTNQTVGRHNYTWVPMVRRTLTQNLFPPFDATIPTAAQWEVYVFVLRNIDAGKGSIQFGDKTFVVKSGGFTADDVGQPVVIRGAGANGIDLVTLVQGLSGVNAILLDPALKTSNNTTYQLPGRIRSAGIVRSSSDLTRFNFTNFRNNSSPPDVVGGQQILANNGVIFNVTRADPLGFSISGLVLPDAQGKYPTSIWFGGGGTQQLFRLDGSEVVK